MLNFVISYLLRALQRLIMLVNVSSGIPLLGFNHVLRLANLPLLTLQSVHLSQAALLMLSVVL